MSKVEVNTIEPQCGTTLTVGKCTTNVAVPGNVVKSNALQASDAGNIISQCGTTITLGASGDSVTLASGATQSGFGRTGTVDWITTAKVTGDSPVTGVSGKGYFMNTTSGTITLNLPAGSAGDIISVQDYNNTFDTYALTVTPNGSEKINGGSGGGNIVLDTEGEGLTLVYVDGTVGWRSIQDSSFADIGAVEITATVSGTCNTLATAPCCSNVKIATFVSPGTFCVSQISSTTARNTVGYMVVAGGASGGSGYGGGGGAGGFREGRNVPIDNFTASPLVANAPTNAVTLTASPYTITVGGGGAGGTDPAIANPGDASTFSTITSAGGGYGRCGNSAPSVGPGGSGGGGGGGGCGAFGTGNDPPTSPSQGNPGGPGSGGTPPAGSGGPNHGRGGGGGAGATGGSGGPTYGGAGGTGVSTSITGASVGRAGGGGGGIYVAPAPGGAGTASDGGGAASPGASPTISTSGTVNTGGGGGGSSYGPAASYFTGSGGGGSGIVVIRYRFQ